MSYPGFEEIEAVPKAVEDRFRNMSYFNLGNLESVNFLARAEDNSTPAVCYVAAQPTASRDGFRENHIYLCQLGPNNQVVGEAKARYCPEEPHLALENKPFVARTFTEYDQQRCGYGIQRLRLLNNLCQVIFSLPLYSDTSITPDAEAVWQKLQKLGEAESMYDQNRELDYTTTPSLPLVTRYKFLS